MEEINVSKFLKGGNISQSFRNLLNTLFYLFVRGEGFAHQSLLH